MKVFPIVFVLCSHAIMTGKIVPHSDTPFTLRVSNARDCDNVTRWLD